MSFDFVERHAILNILLFGIPRGQQATHPPPGATKKKCDLEHIFGREQHTHYLGSWFYELSLREVFMGFAELNEMKKDEMISRNTGPAVHGTESLAFSGKRAGLVYARMTVPE